MFGTGAAAADPDNPIELAARQATPVDRNTVLRRAAMYFLWLAGLILLIWLIGFLPAIFVFMLAYMTLGFGEPWLRSSMLAVVITVACWGLFDRALHSVWPDSLLGNLFPSLRLATGFL